MLVSFGSGQFICAEKGCKLEEGLRTWEVNFAYSEAGVKKNTLVKISKWSRLLKLTYSADI